MPRAFLFKREDVVAAAVELTREGGIGAVTARSLGARLGSSSKPIFSLFDSMEEVQTAVLDAAEALYQDCVKATVESGEYPPYKATGMGYIRFAGEEKELFKLLFMRDRSREQIGEDRESLRPYLALLQNALKLSEDDAYLFHLEMWVWVHGIASMVATSYLPWDTAFVSRALTDAYEGLRWRFSGDKQENGGNVQ